MAARDDKLSFAQVALTRVLIQRMQARRSARYGRWDEAFRNLDAGDKAALELNKARRVDVKVFAQNLENKKKECESKKWTLFTRNDGTEVKLRDVMEKIVFWVRRFEVIGDAIVVFDPVHAALPWAGVKFLIEVSVGDFETYAKMADGLEIVSRIIVQVAEVEKDMPQTGLTQLKTELSRTIVDVYGKVLKFLATARRFFDQNAGVRWVKGMFQGLKRAVKDFVDGVSAMVGEVYRLSNETKWQDSNTKSAERHGELLASLKELWEVLTKPKKSIHDQRAQIRGWLTPILTDDAQKEALGLRHGSTCDWILGHPKFQKWSDYNSKVSKILWLHGPAGFGKSVLCARVIDHMQGDSCIYGTTPFFFCSGGDLDRRHPFAILKSWIGQLVVKTDVAVDTVMEDEQAKQKISDGTITSEADQDYLWSLLSKLVTREPRCTLVIDGYDECLDAPTNISKYHTQSCRVHFLQKLSETIRGLGIRVLLVSRNQPDIEIVMKESSEDPETLDIIDHGVTKDDTKQDLSSFSQTVLENKLGKRQILSVMAEEAVQKSEGMFLWIALLDKNVKKGATKRYVDNLLKTTPSEIYDAYQAELDKILDPKAPNTNRAVVILKWILYAARPLTVREMTEALAVTFNDTPSTYPREDLPLDFAEETVDEDFINNYIRMPCGSLIELRKVDESTPLESHTIHFVHFSVKEFLQQITFCVMASNRRLCFGADNTEHDWIASLCLQYMCYDEFDGTSQNGVNSVSDFLHAYPFFSYTAASWHDHFCRGESSDTSPKTSEIVWQLFSTTHWRTWAELFEGHLLETTRDATGDLQRPAGSTRADSGYASLEVLESDTLDDSSASGASESSVEDEESEVSISSTKREISPSPVYYAAMLGLIEVVRRLIELKPSDGTLVGGELGNPLQAAVVNGQGPTVKLLLEHKADPSQKGGKYGTPLIAAVFLESNDIISQLVDACRDLNAVDREGKTALHYACELGHVGMVTKLVEAGADMNLRTKSGRSPLVRAIMRNHLDVVEFLLKKGADVDERMRGKQTPLFLTVEMESEDAVRLLLTYHANTSCQDIWGVTALHVACQLGSAPITRLLLEHKTAVDLMDEDGWTPLHYAARANSKGVAELLLSHGASPLDKARDGITPYAMALERGYASLVDSLLKSLVQSTLSIDIVKDTLGLALKTDQKALFDEFSEHVLKQESLDDLSNATVDIVVWSEEEKQMIKTLSWGTSTQKAMVLGPVWRSFPAAGDLITDAILPIAVANRSQEMVQLLLQRRADVYRQIRYRSSSAWSPWSTSSLQMAVDQNSRELVALMLEKGRPSADGTSGITLLTALEDTGRRGMNRADFARMLIAHGALDADADNVEDENTTISKDDDATPKEADNDSGIEDEQNDPAGKKSNVAILLDNRSRNLEWWANALVGQWEGTYTYGTEVSRSESSDPTGFNIETARSESLSTLKKDVILFDGGGKDTVAEFTIHGQVMSGRTIRFVKLYPKFGWMYEGKVKETETDGWHLKGRWASRFGGSGGGTFLVTKTLVA